MVSCPVSLVPSASIFCSFVFLLIYLLRFFAGGFPASDERVVAAVAALRAERAKEIQGMSPEWEVDDWLCSVRARIASVKKMSEDAWEGAKMYCRALWPNEPIPDTTDGLLMKLHDVQD